MKAGMFSPLLLLVSLTLGLVAMWAVASPVGATGDLRVGGTWYGCGDRNDGRILQFACTSSGGTCGNCSGTQLQSCSNFGSGYCTDGYIRVALCSPGGSYLPYGGTVEPCGGGGICDGIKTATCY
jgi:hypothetical protein